VARRNECPGVLGARWRWVILAWYQPGLVRWCEAESHRPAMRGWGAFRLSSYPAVRAGLQGHGDAPAGADPLRPRAAFQAHGDRAAPRPLPRPGWASPPGT